MRNSSVYPDSTPLVYQRWVNLCHPLAPCWNTWLAARRFGRWTQRWLELTLAQRWPTIGISGWPNVILSGRLPTLDPRMYKGWANVGPPFTFATVEPTLRPPAKMTLDQQLFPTLGHQSCLICESWYRFINFMFSQEFNQRDSTCFYEMSVFV